MLAVLFELSGSTIVAEEGFRPALPDPGGPERLGTSVFELTDPERTNGLPGEDDRGRAISVQVWYPAKAGGTSERAPYLFEAGLLEAMLSEEYLNISPGTLEEWGEMRTHAVEDAAIAAMGRRPLLLFSHGFGVARANYTSIVEDLASRGYIVAVIDHPYLGLMVRSDGRVLSSTKLPQDEEFSLAGGRVRDVAADAVWVLNRMLGGEGAIGAFARHIDRDRIGMIGHSLGGAAALEICSVDARIRACVNLDGHPFGAIGEEGVDSPFLAIFSRPAPAGDPLGPMGIERRDLWHQLIAKHDSPAFLLTIDETMHLSFGDLHFVVPPDRLQRLGGTIEPNDLSVIVSRALREFLARFLDLEGAESLEELAGAYKGVTLETFNDSKTAVGARE